MNIILAQESQDSMNHFSELLLGIDSGIGIVTASSFAGLCVALAKTSDVDLVIADFAILGKDWKRSFKRLLALCQNTKLAFTSGTSDKEIIRFFMLSGCYGFLPSHYDDETITLALRFMLKGHEHIPSAFLQHKKDTANTLISYRLPDGRSLTPRQIQVLDFLGEGLSNKLIAYKMSVSEATVKLHINALLKNLDVNNRTQAVISAQRLGFL